jgi:hypothetical protein
MREFKAMAWCGAHLTMRVFTPGILICLKD